MFIILLFFIENFVLASHSNNSIDKSDEESWKTSSFGNKWTSRHSRQNECNTASTYITEVWWQLI